MKSDFYLREQTQIVGFCCACNFVKFVISKLVPKLNQRLIIFHVAPLLHDLEEIVEVDHFAVPHDFGRIQHILIVFDPELGR